MATTAEGKVKDKVKAILKEWGVEYFMPAANGYGTGGVSDFICCYNGRFLSIETKAGKAEKPTKLQRLFIDRMLQAGGIALVVHGENTEVLTSTLRRITLGEKF